MSNYAQIITSFERTSDFPLEADFIFSSLDALEEYYSDEVKKATLHKGLFKLVESDEDGKQGLYWVVEENGELTFKELIAGDTVEDINVTLQTLLDGLKALAGVTMTDDDSLKKQIAKIVGCEAEDVMDYLDELTYPTLTKVSETLETLVSSMSDAESRLDDIDEEIDTIEETLSEAVMGVEKTDEGVELVTRMTDDGKIAGAKIVLSTTDNQIIKVDDGLKMFVESEYGDGILTLKVNGDTVATHKIIADALFTEAYYDKDTESLVFIFNATGGATQTVYVPVGSLIREWNVDNKEHSVITLSREEHVEGTDLLSADLKVSKDAGNILSVHDGALFAGANVDNVTYDEGTLRDVIDAMSKEQDALEDRITEVEAKHDEDVSALNDTIEAFNGRIDKVEEEKQDALTAGTGIAIEDNIISITLDTTLYKVVTALPDEPDTEDKNKIFLIQGETDVENNYFVEYLWVNDAWEKIGEAAAADIDLSNYVTTDYLDYRISNVKKQISSRIDSLNNIEFCEHHVAYALYAAGLNASSTTTTAFLALDSLNADVSFPEEGEIMSIWIPKNITNNITQDKELNIGYSISGGGVVFCNRAMPLYTCSVDYAKFENNESIDAVIFSGAEDTEVQYFDENVWSERGFNMIVQNIGEKLLWLNPPPLKSSSK